MSSDRRRKARIQGGGWAASNSKPVAKPTNPMAKPPVWMSKNSSDPAAEVKRVLYEEPEQELRTKPKQKVIDETGVYDLGRTTNGVSRVRLFNKFVDPAECERIFDEMVHVLPWKQRTEKHKGVEYLQPRLTAWYGDHPYSYGDVHWPACKEWPTVLLGLKQRLEDNTGLNFNSMLANLYRDGHDSVAWHADDEPDLGPNPTIASMSFGDSRNFELRQKLPKHRIPREYHDRGPRINLTFRVILPPLPL